MGNQNEEEVKKDELLVPAGPATRKTSVLGVEPVDRGQWTGPFDFLMSMVSCSFI